MLQQGLTCEELAFSKYLQSQKIQTGATYNYIRERVKKLSTFPDKAITLDHFLQAIYNDYSPSTAKVENHIIRYINVLDANRQTNICSMINTPPLKKTLFQTINNSIKIQEDVINSFSQESLKQENFTFAPSFIQSLSEKQHFHQMITLFTKGDLNRQLLMNASNSSTTSLIKQLTLNEIINQNILQIAIKDELIREDAICICAQINILSKTKTISEQDIQQTTKNLTEYVQRELQQDRLCPKNIESLDKETHLKYLCIKTNVLEQIFRASQERTASLLTTYIDSTSNPFIYDLHRQRLYHVLIKNELLREKGIQKLILTKIDEEQNNK